MPIILPPVPGAAKLVFIGLSQQQTFVNTFHLGYTGPVPAQADMNALATAASTAYLNAMIPSLNTLTSLQQVQAIDLSSRTAQIGIDTTVHVGTINAATPPPLQMAACLSWRILDRYRGGHPRMYLPAAQMADIVNGRLWSAGAKARYEAAATGFLTAFDNVLIGPNTWRPVAVRYFSLGVLLTTPLVRDIIDSAVHSRIDSQRRRLGKEVA